MTFSVDSSLHTNDHALYHAAVIYASPDLGAYQPDLARELFVRLLQRHPHSVHRAPAARFIALIDEVDRVRHAGIQRQQQLEVERRILEMDLAQVRDDLEAIQSRLLAQDEQNADLRQAVEQLTRTIRNREEQLAVLRTELDRLKAIDLKVPPGPGHGARGPRGPLVDTLRG